VLSDTSDSDGTVHKWHGHPVEMEDSRMLFRADDIEYDESTGDVHATGHVYFRNFDRNEQIWAGRLEYNTQDETGKFYDVRGETHPRIVTRPARSPPASPFHFEGQWAERIGEKYILYNGLGHQLQNAGPVVADARSQVRYHSRPARHLLPLRVPVAEDAAVLHAILLPFAREGAAQKRFSQPQHRSQLARGFLLGIGYFWAIKRSYDLTYLFQDYTPGVMRITWISPASRARATDSTPSVRRPGPRRTEQRESPSKVQRRQPLRSGKVGFGRRAGRRGRHQLHHFLPLPQEWTQSYNEAVGSKSIGGLPRQELVELHVQSGLRAPGEFSIHRSAIVDPATGNSHYVANAVTIRKLPEAELSSRDHLIWKNIPLWFSFQSAAGLLYRSEPVFDSTTNPTVLIDTYKTGQFANRLNLAPHVTTAFHWEASTWCPASASMRLITASRRHPIRTVSGGGH